MTLIRWALTRLADWLAWVDAAHDVTIEGDETT